MTAENSGRPLLGDTKSGLPLRIDVGTKQRTVHPQFNPGHALSIGGTGLDGDGFARLDLGAAGWGENHHRWLCAPSEARQFAGQNPCHEE